jgi:hypothetical protein
MGRAEDYRERETSEIRRRSAFHFVRLFRVRALDNWRGSFVRSSQWQNSLRIGRPRFCVDLRRG